LKGANLVKYKKSCFNHHLSRHCSSTWSLLWSASRPLLSLLSTNPHHIQTSNTSNTRQANR